MPRLSAALGALALAACAPPLVERYEAGNAALSTSEGAMYFVVMSPILQQELNRCIPVGTPRASPTLVLVADVAADGTPSAVRVEPDSPGTDCLRDALAARQFPKPPLAAGQATFPIGLKIETK